MIFSTKTAIRKILLYVISASLTINAAVSLPILADITGTESFPGILSASAETLEDYSYIFDSDGNVCINSYKGTLKDVVIPSEIEGCPVRTIGMSAFKNNQNIMSVYIPDSVENILMEAFRGCSNLENIRMSENIRNMTGDAFFGTAWYNNQPDTVIYLGKVLYAYKNAGGPETDETVQIINGTRVIADFAFESCYDKLKNVKIPDSVITIGNRAFYNCRSLTGIVLPGSVEKIGYSAFENCRSLASINLPGSLRYIGYSAFKDCSSLTRITVPYGVTAIDEDTFRGCTNLTYISLPSSLLTVSGSAFSGTAWDENYENNTFVYIDTCFLGYKGTPQESFSVNIRKGTTVIGNYALSYNQYSNPLTVYLPDGLKSIGFSAFQKCRYLKSISIPDSVQYIQSEAFAQCYNLESVKLPSDTKVIGDFAFARCKKLNSITIPDGVESTGENTFQGCTSLSRVRFGNTLKTIDKSAFTNCTELTEIDVPDNVTTIDNNAFNACTKLTTVSTGEGIRYIGFSAFQNCTNLESIKLGSGIDTIESFAFQDCQKLQKLVLPDNISVINSSSFEGCTGLTELTLPKKLETIRSSAFKDCSSLTDAVIPAGTKTIEKYAFRGCSSLKRIIIPESVTKIEDYAFNGCPDAVIYGVLGSQAHSYAYSHNIPFIALLSNKSTISADTIRLGSAVTVKADANGGIGNYKFALYYKKTSDSKWATVQSFKENSVISFKPGKAVSYNVCVKVMDTEGTIEKKYFTVKVKPRLVNNTSVSSEEIKAGGSITVNAAASGGAGRYTYAILYKKSSDTKWATVQNYSTNDTCSIRLKKAVPYDVYVKVKDSEGVIVKKYFTVNVI